MQTKLNKNINIDSNLISNKLKKAACESLEFIYTATSLTLTPNGGFVINCVYYLDEPQSAPSPTPSIIPMSVDLPQMTVSGSVTCNQCSTGLSSEELRNIGCTINDLEAPSAYQCGFVCNTSD